MAKHNVRDDDGKYAEDKSEIGKMPMVARPGQDYIGPDSETVERQNERKKGSR